MGSFWQRLLPSLFGDGTDRRKAPRQPGADRRQPASATTTVASAKAPVDGAEQTLAPLAAAGARRPLIAANGDVVGFEFRIAQDTVRRLRRRADQNAQAAHVMAVLASARLTAQTGRIGLARVPAEWLLSVSRLATSQGSWVAIEALDALSADMQAALLQAVAQLRAAGAKLGWSADMLPMAIPEFMLLTQAGEPMQDLLQTRTTWSAARQALPVLLTDLANVEDIELALQSGVAYVCGALAPKPGSSEQKDVLPTTSEVTPEVKRVAYLLNQLVTGADTRVIVSQIKGDVGLSYRLLRRINSASFAQLHADATIEQAVAMLGRNELYRWLSMLLVQFAGTSKTSSALQELALWRSRLMELLAIARQEESPGQLFTMGLASLLGALLRMRQDEVVATLNLPEPAQQALLHQSGPWHGYLQLAQQVEANTLEDAEVLAELFGGLPQVLALSDEAWAWATKNSAPEGGQGSATRSL